MEGPFPAYRGDEPYVFVSYAHGDSALVYPEIQWLKDQGFNIWYDEGIAPGHEWRDELAERISSSSLFLFFVTPASVSSEHCRRELNYAIDVGIPLLAAYLRETELPGGMQLSLNSVQAILRHELSDLNYRIKLLRGVAGYLERGIGAVGAPARIGPGAMALAGAVLAGLLIGGIVIGLAFRTPVSMEPGSADHAMRFNIDLSPAYFVPAGQPLGVTPDGTRIVFTGFGARGRQLFSRSLNDLVPAPIRGTEDSQGGHGAASFALSPDSEWVAFHSPTDLTVKKVRITGGTPITLTKVTVAGQRGLAWGPRGSIVITRASYPGLLTLSENGGTAEPLTAPAEGVLHSSPHFLPDGSGLLFVVQQSGQSEIAFLSLESGEQKILTHGSAPQVTPEGHLIFCREGELWAAAFDTRRGELTSEEVPVGDAVLAVGDEMPVYSVSRNGTLVFVSPGASVLSDLVWVDRQGREQKLGVEPGSYFAPRISPDGGRFVVSIHSPSGYDLWAYSLEREMFMRLTFDDADEILSMWSPDGKRILYPVGNGPTTIWSRSADGSGAAQPIGTTAQGASPTSWSHDGQTVLYHSCANNTCFLGAIGSDGDPQEGLFPKVDDWISDPALSPDGKWLAYESSERGQTQIYVRPFPELDSGRWQVSANGGVHARWAPNGRELFYRSAGGMIAVSVETGAGFRVGQANVLFEANPYADRAIRDYDVTPDGERFLMIKPKTEANRRLTVVLNWFEELARLAPAAR